MVLMVAMMVLALLLAAAFFAGSETAFTSVSHASLHQRAMHGDQRAAFAQRFMERIDLILGTTLVGTNVMQVSATTLAALVIDGYVSGDMAPLATTVVMTPLILLIGELVPKSIGRTHADALVPLLAWPLRLAQLAFYPVVWSTATIAAGVGRLFGQERQGTPAGGRMTRDDMRAVAAVAAEDGVLPESAALMMQTVLGLGGKPVSAVMKPLVDVVAVAADGTVGDLEDLAIEHGYSRYPVFESRVDEIVGVIDLRQMLYGAPVDAARQGKLLRQAPLAEFIRRDLLFVPETKPVRDLLQELHFHRLPMAAVVDEHGGVTGIITAEDLVEEVVGEILDERDEEAPALLHPTDRVWECDGRLELADLGEELGYPFKPGPYDTVAGLVLHLAGKIPAVGEQFVQGPFVFEVLAVEKHRLARLRVTRK